MSYDYPRDDSLTDDYAANEEAIASYERSLDRDYDSWRENFEADVDE